MFMKKLVSVVLCLVLLMASVVVLIPEMTTDVSAATYRTAYNGPSSSYKGSKYYQHYQRITLTGDNVTDTLALALSQLGYHEGASTSDMDGISSSNGNYTEFNYNMGDWGSGYTYEWCATFCSWALYQSHTTNQGSMSDWCRRHSGDSNYIWREVGCPAWISNLKSAGKWKYSQYYGGSYKPQPGDLIFFRSGAHIGMVVYSDSSYVYTIEGNTSDAAGIEPAGGGVFFKKYSLSASGIDGYGTLPYKTNSSVQKIDYSGANPTLGLYISNAVKYVYSSATSTTTIANMPRFTMFEVTDISNGRLKATYTTSSGQTVTGWVINNTDRVIQLTHKAAENVSMTLKCVDEKGNVLKTQTLTGPKGTTATIPAPAITGYVCTQSSVSATYTSGATVTLTYKTLLDATVAAASNTRYCDYTPSALATLRSVYNQAVAMQKNTSATVDQKTQMATQLQNAINNTIFKDTVISKGKTYTATATTRTDNWKDDGKRLTDGTKGNYGSATTYAGWAPGNNGSIEVVVDLGSNVSSNVYRIYTSANAEWAVNVPVQLTVYASTDNKTFTPVGFTDSETATATDGTWTNYTMTVRTNEVKTARYIKFKVTGTSGHIWLEEVEVASAGIGAKDQIYVDGINTKVSSGKTVVFTPAFGDITTATANHKYTLNIVAKWSNTSNSYVVKRVSKGTGDTTPAIKLASDEILIASHAWEYSVTNPVYFSENNYAKLESFKVGNTLYLNNVNVANATLGATATVSMTAPSKTPIDYSNLVYGKDYTALTKPNRNDAFDDDGIKLTDGMKSALNVNLFPSYSAWKAPADTKDFSVELLFDLGSVKKSDTYKAYFAGGTWGIALPKDSISVEVYASDKEDSGFELIASTKTGDAVLVEGTGKDDNTWSLYTVTATANEAVSARYIKLVIKHKEVADKESHIWIDEVEVFNLKADGTTAEIPTGTDYQNVAYGKDYEGGKVSSAGSQYSADLTDGKAHNVGSFDSNWYALYYNKSATADKITAPDGIGTIIVDLEKLYKGISEVKVHVWNSNANGILPAKSIKLLTSEDGTNYTSVGNLSIPAGNDPAWATIKTNSISARYVKLVVETQSTWTFLNEIEVIADLNYDPNGTPSEPEIPTPGESTNIAFNKDYVGGDAAITAEGGSASTHNAKLTDGKAIDTIDYNGGWLGLWYNKNATTASNNAPDGIANIIIDLEKVYDGINEVKLNLWLGDTASGIAGPDSITVSFSKDGKTYGEAIEIDVPAGVSTSAWATKAIDNVSARYVKFTIGTKAVWTFLNEIEVYADPNYVPDSDPEVSDPEIEGDLADVDSDGDVDAADYVLVKRAVLNTYELSEQQKLVADIDADGDVDATDYVLVKRIVLGTYTVK